MLPAGGLATRPAQGGAAEGTVGGLPRLPRQRREGGVGYCVLRARGWACCPGWACEGRTEAKGQDQAGSKGRKPRGKGRETLAEIDTESPETARGTIRERKLREGGSHRSWSESQRPLT